MKNKTTLSFMNLGRAGCLALLSVLFAGFAKAQTPCVDPDLIDPTMMCFQIYDPVCGCNGVTYPNACHATYYGGVTSYTPGPCSDDDDDTGNGGPGNGNPGQGHGNQGQGNQGQGHGNQGQGNQGQGQGHGNQGQGNQGQGHGNQGQGNQGQGHGNQGQGNQGNHGTGNNGQGKGNSGGNCVNPNLIDSTAFCILIYAPVCGCDGVTYSNACFATIYGGVTSYTEGECGSDARLSEKNGAVSLSVYPNPVTTYANIGFTLDVPGDVKIEIFDAVGQKLLELENGYRLVGAHSVLLDGTRLGTGQYLIRISVDGKNLGTNRLVVVK